jgi:hypothetical protein
MSKDAARMVFPRGVCWESRDVCWARTGEYLEWMDECWGGSGMSLSSGSVTPCWDDYNWYDCYCFHAIRCCHRESHPPRLGYPRGQRRQVP